MSLIFWTVVVCGSVALCIAYYCCFLLAMLPRWRKQIASGALVGVTISLLLFVIPALVGSIFVLVGAQALTPEMFLSGLSSVLG